MKNLAIIPARSGSKGLKNKNIKPLNGKPLMAYSIEAALESKMFDKVVLSTDSEEYASIGETYGATIPYLRSADLSNDTASSWDVVRDIVQWYSSNGDLFDTVTLLQPTSPLRTSNDITEAYKFYQEKKAELVIGVTEVDHSPIWMNTLPKDSSMFGFLDNQYSKMPRQQLPTYYRINGALYIISVEHLFSSNDFYSEKSYAYVMDQRSSVDIDTDIDFAVAEAIIKKFNKLEGIHE